MLGRWRVTPNGYEMSYGDDEIFLKLHHDDGGITL